MNLVRYISLILIVMFGVLDTHAQINRLGVKNEWNTDVENSSISLYEYEALTPNNVFKSITNPRFYNEEKAHKHYNSTDNVVVLSAGREYKAYPMDLLMYHQVINDRIGGKPVAITYCPFTDAVIAYERRFQHKGVQRELTFQPSGMIRKSNMVLFDEQSESWWQQYTGDCKTGDFNGTQLKEYPLLKMTMQQFYDQYKYGLVIRNTERDELLPYGKNPYYKYDNVLTEKPLYLDNMPSERLMPMERIITVNILDKHILYPLEEVQHRGVINDMPMDMYVVVFYEDYSTSMLEGREIKENKRVGSAAVFSAFHNSQLLTFSKEEDYFVDEQTKSIWDFRGHCIKGKFKGQQLKLLSFKQSFAFPELEFYPNSLIYNINW